MATGDLLPYWINKKLLPYDVMKEQFFDYIEAVGRDAYSKMYRADGVYDTQATVTGSAIGEVSVPGAFTGTDGLGFTLDFSALDSRLQDVPFENSNGVEYHLGIQVVKTDREIEINPRTGQPQYSWKEEDIGNIDNPDAVVDNGTNLTLTVDTVCEGVSGPYSHAGRTVRVWLKYPEATTASVAFEECTIVWDGSNNKITTTGLLGQTTSVSTTITDYYVMEMGPRIVRSSSQDLTIASGILFLASFDGNVSAPPSPSMTGQKVLIASLIDIDDLWGLAKVVIASMAVEGLKYLGESPSTYAQIEGGRAWVEGPYAAYREYANTSVGPLTASSTLYIYIDESDHIIKFTATKSTAYNGSNLPLIMVTTDGSSNITSSTDIAFRSSRINRQGIVTVSSGDEDNQETNFKDFQAAIDWITQQNGLSTDEYPGVELWLVGSIELTSSVTIPQECNGLTIRGVNWNGQYYTDAKSSLWYDDTNTDLTLLKLAAKGLRFIGIHFQSKTVGAGSTRRFIDQLNSPSVGSNIYFEGCLFDTLYNQLEYCFIGTIPTGANAWNDSVLKDCIFDVSSCDAILYRIGENWIVHNCIFYGTNTTTLLVGGGYNSGFGEYASFFKCEFNGMFASGIDNDGGSLELSASFYDCNGELGTVRNGLFVNCRFTDTELVPDSNDWIIIDGSSITGDEVIQSDLSTSQIDIRDSRIISSSDTLIQAPTGTVENIRIYNSYLSASGAVGDNYIELGNDCVLDGCIILSAETSAIAYDLIQINGNDNVINNCDINASYLKVGVHFVTGVRNKIEGSKVQMPQSQATNSAIAIRVDSDRVQILSNRVWYVGDTTYGGIGMYVLGDYICICDNFIYSIEGPAIFSTGNNYCLINDNLMDNLSSSVTNPITSSVLQDGIYLEGDYGVFSGNIVQNVLLGYGLRIKGDYNDFSGNILTDEYIDEGTGNIPGVYGSFYAEDSDDTLDTTTSTTPVEKLSLTFTAPAAGVYRIGWSYDWHQTNGAQDFVAQVQIDDTTTIASHQSQPIDTTTDQYNPASGFYYATLTAASHDIDLDYWTTVGGTARIRNARLEVVRVS